MMTIQRTKILRDLWANKSRTLLVVLATAVGVAAFGLMITGRIVLQQNLTDAFAATHPAHSVLSLSPFGDDLLNKVRALPEVQTAEGRHYTQAKIETTPGRWLDLRLNGMPDVAAATVSRVTLQAPLSGNSYSPAYGKILLERSVKEQFSVVVGQTVLIQTLDGKTHDLEVAGFVNDLAYQPTPLSLTVYGYTSLDTLAALGEPTTYNEMYVRLKGDPADRPTIEQGITKVTDAIQADGGQVYSAPVAPPGKQIMSDSMNSVLLILGALGALTLALSAFLVINIISAVISQQIPQIGILKSLGGRSSQLMRLYFELVLWFGVMALILAVPLGVIGGYFMAQGIASSLNFDVLHFWLPGQTLILQFVGAIIVPLLAASVPILVGSRITIRQAITGNDSGASATVGPFGRFIARLGELPQMIRVAIGNTFRRKGRLILTLATLTLAGAMFIALIGIRQSLRDAVNTLTSRLNYDVSLTLDRPYPIGQIQVEAQKVAGVARSQGWGLADGRRVYDDGHLSGSIGLIAVPPGTDLTIPSPVQGRWLRPDDGYVLYVNTDMTELAPDLTVGKQITLRIGGSDHTWQIVGISARDFYPIAYMPYSTFEKVTGLTGLASQVVVRTTDSSPAFQAKVQADLLAQFSAANIQVVSSATTTQAKQSSADSLDILVILLMVMVVLISLVGGMGLAITMGLNVLERTREIGILRSLGATNGVIRGLVMVEGVIISVISWAVGAVVSIPLGMWLGNALGISLLARPLDYAFSWSALDIWLALVLVIAVIASLVPAQNAARLTIRDTLAYIG